MIFFEKKENTYIHTDVLNEHALLFIQEKNLFYGLILQNSEIMIIYL